MGLTSLVRSHPGRAVATGIFKEQEQELLRPWLDWWEREGKDVDWQARPATQRARQRR